MLSRTGFAIRRKKRKHCLRAAQPLVERTDPNQEWDAGLFARRRGVRANDTRPERGGCLHPRMPGAGSGHRLRQSVGDTSAGDDRGRTWTAGRHPLRQRSGADQPAFSRLVRGAANRSAAHSARQTDTWVNCLAGFGWRTWLLLCLACVVYRPENSCV